MMSSVISTKAADTPVSSSKSAGPQGRPSAGLVPWQFFVLAALGCATAVNVMVRGQGITTIVLLTVLVGSTALVGIAALRTLNPLVTDEDDRTVIIGGRTRAALEREKVLALRAIKELEFDRAMGKVSEKDFTEMSARLRARAARILRQLDAAGTYREQIEQEIDRRLGPPKSAARPRPLPCPSCGTTNDADAKFCKNCGGALEARA